MTRFALILSLSFTLVACGGDDAVCTPGSSTTCITGACTGVQMCLADGTGYGTCVCEGDDAGTDTSTGGDTGTADTSVADTGVDDTGGSDTGVADSGMDTAPPPTCEETGMSYEYTINVNGIPPEMPPGVVEGFNIDGLVSTVADAAGCRKVDYTSPSGVEGIDNSLINLESLIGGIVEGGLRFDEDLAVSLANVDSFMDDDCVTIGIAGSTPIVGTIVDGHLSVGPVERVDLAAAGLSITIYDVLVEADLTETTVTNGVLGGVMIVNELVTAATPMLPDGVSPGIVRSLLRGQADLNPPMCDRLSGALLFETAVAPPAP